MSGTPQAFLSYTRLDDQGHEGGITALRAALELQVRIVTGDDSFEIFQDVDGIAFGEHWPKKLDQALAAARFLIPILSPHFFKSGPCRDELRRFLAHERAAGRDDLILPIYLVRAPILEQPHLTTTDELASELARAAVLGLAPTCLRAAVRSDRAKSGARACRGDRRAARPRIATESAVGARVKAAGVARAAIRRSDLATWSCLPRRRCAVVPRDGRDPGGIVHDGIATDRDRPLRR